MSIIVHSMQSLSKISTLFPALTSYLTNKLEPKSSLKLIYALVIIRSKSSLAIFQKQLSRPDIDFMNIWLYLLDSLMHQHTSYILWIQSLCWSLINSSWFSLTIFWYTLRLKKIMLIIYVSFFNDYVITTFMLNSLSANSGSIVWSFWGILSPVKAYRLIQPKFRRLWIGSLQLQSIKFVVSLDWQDIIADSFQTSPK
jgi:hypothetical protein